MTFLSYEEIGHALTTNTLFDQKSWHVSSQALKLPEKASEELLAIGQACTAFYKAQDFLYKKSALGESILRNIHQEVPWVKAYLDRGKPQAIIEHASVKYLKGRIPSIIRPDLLWTEDGWKLTELDCVPGGIGLTAYLYRVYGIDDGCVDIWYRAVAANFEQDDPVIGIVVSDESATYRPECEWMSRQLRNQGKKVYCLSTQDIFEKNNEIYFSINSEHIKIDIVYRFFELFDHENIECMDILMKSESYGQVKITPPIKHYQEEKANLALFHVGCLEAFWREQLGDSYYELLKKIIPKTWIMDFEQTHPFSAIYPPLFEDKPIYNWLELGNLSQKEKHWVMKISGFHPTAWGARGVVLANDVSRESWIAALDKARLMSDQSLHILQHYYKPIKISHPSYNEHGQEVMSEWRLRLCPYYGNENNKTHYMGALATLCLPDKKIIHGMRDAVLVPLVKATQSQEILGR